MKKLLLGCAVTAALVVPASAQAAAGYVLVTLGFVFSNYATVDACLAAGASMRSSTPGYIPNYYCVPITNATAVPPMVGGGAGPF